jgi:DNA polymerase-3 subunit delta
VAKVKAKDTLANYERILGDLKKKIYHPIYLLMGEEAYYIDQISNYIGQHVLTETERSFNQLVVYGKDMTAAQLVDTARRFPMMANQQVVIVREAQLMKNIEHLEAYAKQPAASTLLVICYKGKSLDKRSVLYKSIVKCGEVLETATLYDNEVTAWVSGYLQQKGCTIDAKAGAILVEFLGVDLIKITHELDKLFTLLPEGCKHITADHIEKNIGISKEYNVFELNSAVAQRNILKANRIAQHFAHNPSEYPLILTINSLFMEFARILKYHFLIRKPASERASSGNMASEMGVNPYFMRDYAQAVTKYSISQTMQAISLIREYDMRSKGFLNGSASHSELLRELLFKIMHL